MAQLILNRLKNNLKIAAVKAPSFGDNRKAVLQDIAIFTGGKFISEEAGLTLESATANPEEIKATLGVAKNVTITKDDTIILHGNGNKYYPFYAEPISITEWKSFKNKSKSLRAHMTGKSSKKDWLSYRVVSELSRWAVPVKSKSEKSKTESLMPFVPLRLH